jgi:2-dehydropantoate 2-reductase
MTSGGAAPVLIWGAGAIGGTLGAHMARAGVPVHMVDVVEEHVAAMREHGLRIEGPVEEMALRLPADTPGTLRGAFGKVILAVKAHHTEEALEMLVPHLAPGGYVVSAQNGLNERAIAARIGAERTVGCFVNFGADWLGPGRILYGNRAAAAVGELDGRITSRAREVHSWVSLVEPGAALTDNIWGWLWGKMGYGALLFCTALSTESMADAIARPEHRPAYRALGAEVMRLARAEGVAPIGFDGFDPEAFAAGDRAAMDHSLDALVAHNRRTAKTHSGVWRDLAVRRRKTEVDAQIGPMLGIARGHGVPVPALARLIALIHDVEAGRRAQGPELVGLLVPACA